MRVVRVLALALLVVVVTSCGSGVESARQPLQDETVAIPTQSDGFPGEDAQVGGVLRGDAEDGCLWLEQSDGGRLAVLWPPQYSAMFDPVRLVAPDGEVVAREGEAITGGGGLYRETIPRCQFGQETVVRIHGIKARD